MGKYVGPDTEMTLLPFFNAVTAAKIFGVLIASVILVYIVRAFVYKKSLTFRRAPTAEVFYTIIASLMNCVVYMFFYWYIAVFVSLAVSLAFMKAIQMEVKEANEDERIGVWGLNEDIRTIRGELFNDMSIEEQLEYRNNVKEYKFRWYRFLLITVGFALLLMSVFYFLDMGYLWFPVKVPN